METGLYALLTKIGAIFAATLAFFHISLSHVDLDKTLNYLPFISATIQGKPTPMITRIIEMCIGGAVTILLGYIFMVPSLSKDIQSNMAVISYKIDSIATSQHELKEGQNAIAQAVNEVDDREKINDLKQQNEIDLLKSKVR